jgi:hypothetical protein
MTACPRKLLPALPLSDVHLDSAPPTRECAQLLPSVFHMTRAGIEKKQKTIFEALEETNTKKTKTKKE